MKVIFQHKKQIVIFISDFFISGNGDELLFQLLEKIFSEETLFSYLIMIILYSRIFNLRNSYKSNTKHHVFIF
ncbi:hypothetical protein BC008_05290 [Mastigocoleus testarum BC008]|uniref:Uncharacterized protein n=1 Tax=Mastigocoleus testarum BC008 TaxID=371196 RepID=A0A0V7ZYR7_9CYAN|nr:hypothetical protein BC008_04990 [Mastigocoleus testarum BC008]KST69712.1 hypothetical protein BC008_05290 [Mastigocoleus testarum BC008]